MYLPMFILFLLCNEGIFKGPLRRYLESSRNRCWCVTGTTWGHCGLRLPSSPFRSSWRHHLQLSLGTHHPRAQPRGWVELISYWNPTNPVSGTGLWLRPEPIIAHFIFLPQVSETTSRKGARPNSSSQVWPKTLEQRELSSSWASEAAGCQSGATSSQLFSCLKWRQPPRKQSQGMENEWVLRHCQKPWSHPNMKSVPHLDFPVSGASEHLFSFSPKESRGAHRPMCQLQTAGHLDAPKKSPPSPSGPQSCELLQRLPLCPPCAVTPSPWIGRASKGTEDNIRKHSPVSSTCFVYIYFICRNPLASLSRTGACICMFCSIMLHVLVVEKVLKNTTTI